MQDQNLKTHHGRNDLIGEHKWGDLGQVIFLVAFLIIWVLDSFVFEYSVFLEEYIPNYISKPVAIIVLVTAFLLAMLGMKNVFGTVRKTPEVISNGVFAYVRHPIYLGALLLYAGLIILTLSIISMGFWFIILVFYMAISRYEEKVLTNYFGEEYKAYMKRVPMLFPRLFKMK